MHIRIDRDRLLTALQAVGGAVERRQTLPVLGHFLFIVEEEILTVVGSDLELELSARLPVAVTEAGSGTVPARKLIDICRNLPAGSEVVLRRDQARLILQCGRSRYVLAGLEPTDYPRLAGEAVEWRVELPQQAIGALLGQTQFAMALQDVRYYLNGLLLHFHHGSLRAIATDGHRLAYSEWAIGTEAPTTLQLIVPRKAVMEWSRLLNEEDATVLLEGSTQMLAVHLPGQTLRTKLIDGRFPDYQNVIPASSGQRLELEREELREAVQRAAVLANEKHRGVRLKIERDRLTLEATNTAQEAAEEVIEANYDGEPMEICFNASYVLDVLGVMRAERVRFHLRDSRSSSLVQAIDDSPARYVMMPIQL